MCQVCAVDVYAHHLLDSWFSPIVPNSGRNRDLAKDSFQLVGFRPEAWQVLAGNSYLDGYSNRFSRFERSRIDDCSGDLFVKLRLQKCQQRSRIVIVPGS